MQQCIKILLFLILNEAQRVSGDTPPIIWSLKLHKQPLVLHTWKVVGLVVVGRCKVAYASTYAKPEAACAVLGSWWWTVCRPKHVELYLKQGITKFRYTVAPCWVFHCKNCLSDHVKQNQMGGVCHLRGKEECIQHLVEDTWRKEAICKKQAQKGI